jgi:hypothetical protein
MRRDLATLIDADDPVIGDLLAATVELVVEAGGWIDGSARLVARDGQLSIESGTEGPLLRIPRAAAVRVDRVTWGSDGDRLTVEDVPADVGEVELQMAYLQVALHNQCDKLGWLTRTHPSLTPDLPDEVAHAVGALLPSFRRPPPDPVDLFFNNRCFRIPINAGEPPERMLLPLVDLLNHHTAGARGDWDGQSFSVASRRPFGTDECALDYGMERDAIETAVVYGFADASATVAHSAPVTVEVPGVGTVQVLAPARTATGLTAAPTAESTSEGTILSRLTFRLDDVDASVRETMAATGWQRSDAAAVVDVVRAENLSLLADVIRAAAGDDSAATTTLSQAATVQSAVIEAVSTDAITGDGQHS